MTSVRINRDLNGNGCFKMIANLGDTSIFRNDDYDLSEYIEQSNKIGRDGFVTIRYAHFEVDDEFILTGYVDTYEDCPNNMANKEALVKIFNEHVYEETRFISPKFFR